MDGSRGLVLGIFEGVPATQKSVFDLCLGPERIVLYQKNIEAICASDVEICHEIRQTVLHELAHYFGMNEDQLKDVQMRFFIPTCRMAAFSVAALADAPLTSVITASVS